MLPSSRLVILMLPALLLKPLWASENANTMALLMAEIDRQNQRIQELEEQNRMILGQLQELQALLEGKYPGILSGEKPGLQAHLVGPAAIQPAPPPAVSPAAVQQPGQPADTAPLLTEGRSRVTFYGLIRSDAIFDDSRASDPQTPTFILSEDPSVGPHNQSSFTFHPRLTRLGLNYRGPVVDGLAGARIGGKFEADFQNGGRESRALPRYRHAYFNLAWENVDLLIGQTWDIISPLYPTVNGDTLMWNAGNLGDRRIQARFTYEPDNGFSLRAGAGLTGAVADQDRDSNNFLDGEDAAIPNLQARLGYRSPDQRFELGFWSHYAQEQTTAVFGGENDFGSYSFGFDYNLGLSSLVNLKGELWWGSNLADFRGSIGQSFNPSTGEEIFSRGGWIELGLDPPGIYAFTTGFTIDDPGNEDLFSGGRTANRAWYVTNQLRLAPPFLLGIDYLFWRTDYRDLEEGTDNRVNAYFIYNW